MWRRIGMLVLTVTVSLGAMRMSVAQSVTQSADVVVYGGTSAGVIAAVQAKKLGHSVVIVCPDKHLGGLSSGGLGFTDTGNKAVIGGLAREFYHRVWKQYQLPENWKWQSRDQYGNKGQGTPAIDGEQRTMWIFEPHIAEQVFEEFIRDFEIPVHRNEWLDRERGVVVKERRVQSLKTLSGKTFVGKMFIDATYEGDLMASANVKFHVGRESVETYGEKWNGIQVGVLHHGHHFGAVKSPIDPYVIPGNRQSGLLPRISPEPPGVFGAADKRVQAYCYRMCLTNHDANRVPFAKPEGYDPQQYELLARVFAAGWRETFHKFDPIPNHKTDTNNHGPFSTDNIGFNYNYPEASYERRREILKEHQTYQKGLMYFIANDPRVPDDVRSKMSQWGLSRDEFVDNEHWPHQIYVREARRLIGRHVMTENELLKRRPTPESVGMGSYTMDSHNVQRYVTPEGTVQNEGDIGVGTNGPYEISLGSLQPKKEECENLLVPICLSSSHIAYGSIRMEPVFMILGHSAATVASLAIEQKAAVQDVPYAPIRDRLLKDGQVLEHQSSARSTSNAGQGSVEASKLAGIVVDDSQAKLTGEWSPSHAAGKWVGASYLHDGAARDGKAIAEFVAKLPKAGRYEVRISYATSSNRASNVPVTVKTADGDKEVRLNQRQTPNFDGLFFAIGEWDMPAEASVTIRNRDTDGHVIIDAVQWLPK